MDDKKLEQPKMTLEEYQEKYNKPENVKAAKTFLFVFAAGIGIVVGVALFFLVMKLFEIHQIAGYCGIAVAVLVFIFCYIVPVYKIYNTKAFITNVNSHSARAAQKYNKQLREEIADKMIDINAKSVGVTWYSEEAVGKLAIARHTNDNQGLKTALTAIYDTDVKKAANKLIHENALKVGLATALSQNEKLDTLLVCVYDLKLIKDIIYLYGFRPSDAKLAKIYRTVIADALVAFGLGSLSTSITSKLGQAADSIPFVGGLVSTVIDSATQGIVNASLTVKIGIQTKKYLRSEYNLQNILDEIDLSDEALEAEETELNSEVKTDLKDGTKNKKLTPVGA